MSEMQKLVLKSGLVGIKFKIGARYTQQYIRFNLSTHGPELASNSKVFKPPIFKPTCGD